MLPASLKSIPLKRENLFFQGKGCDGVRAGS